MQCIFIRKKNPVPSPYKSRPSVTSYTSPKIESQIPPFLLGSILLQKEMYFVQGRRSWIRKTQIPIVMISHIFSVKIQLCITNPHTPTVLKPKHALFSFTLTVFTVDLCDTPLFEVDKIYYLNIYRCVKALPEVKIWPELKWTHISNKKRLDRCEENWSPHYRLWYG